MYTYNPQFTIFYDGNQYETDPMELAPVPINHNHSGKRLYQLWNIPKEVAENISFNAKWKQIKEYRNKLLSETDWIVTRSYDQNLPLSQEWKDYRQALRDITDQSDPDNIVWPIKPQ